MSMSANLTFCLSTAADSDLLADLVLGEPSQESTRVAMRLYGLQHIEDARAVFRIVWRAGENWRESTIARDGEVVVGVVQTQQTERSSARMTPRVAIAVLLALGLARSLRLPSRLRLQKRVSPKKPPDAYVISEIHVAPPFRGQGFGAELLAYAERDARARSFRRMALHTLTTNPAQHLYRRCGYEIVETLTDPEFLRITGADGNVLMVKHLV
jgi:ribosomal protein S18 acetylase RimI-like enzyme